MSTTEHTYDMCNALLTLENAAVESYSQVIDKYDPEATDRVLERIRADHQANVFELNQFIMDLAMEPSAAAGTWAGVDEALKEPDVLLGEAPVLKCLQAGEELGISQYENALASEDVSVAAKTLIKRRLLPALSGHLIDLQQMRDLGNEAL